MLLLVWVSSSFMQAEVPLEEVCEGHVYGEALFTDPDDVVHAQVPQLVEHHGFIVGVGGLVLVWFDAPHIPEKGTK